MGATRHDDAEVAAFGPRRAEDPPDALRLWPRTIGEREQRQGVWQGDGPLGCAGAGNRGAQGCGDRLAWRVESLSAAAIRRSSRVVRTRACMERRKRRRTTRSGAMRIPAKALRR